MQTTPGVETALSASEVLPLQVAAILPGVVYQMHCGSDGTSRFTFVNEASTAVLGITPAEMLHDVMSYRQIIEPDDLQTLMAAAAVHNQDLRPWSRQYRILHPSLGLRWIQSSAHLEKLPDGQIQWTGFLTDVTRIKNAETALLLSERRFSEAWKSSRVGMALVSLEGHWMDVNAAMCEFLGRSEAELLAIDFQSITHPDDLSRDLALVTQLLEGEIEDFTLEKRYLHLRHGFVWGLLTVALIRDTDGRPMHFLSQVQDIDQRKRAEEALRISEERIALAAKAGHVGMWDFYFDTGRIVWNDAQYAIHGVNRETYTPSLENNNRFLHPEDRARVDAAFAKCIDSGSTQYQIECRIIRADGAVRTTRSNALIFRNEAGQPLRAVGTEVDITEQQQLVETMARARKAAEAAVKTKSDFIARMSHEIRTPLNAILAPGQLLAASHLNPAQEELITMIVGAGEHLLQVINDILDFSKLEAGKMKVVTEGFAIEALSEEVKILMSILAERKGLSLETVVDPAVHGLWYGDENRIKQVLINLVSNAIKYSTSGEVTLRISPGSIREGVPSVHFEVQDMGFGLSSSQQKKLFQPFEQIGSRDRESGTGLGLAICRDLVELMGGTIACNSHPGQGSCFWFEIPLRRQGRSQEPAGARGTTQDQPAASARPSRILVVEDNPSNRRVVSLLLKRMGHATLFAVNGRQALEKIAEEDFDLVLMDCEVPIMDGLESTREIRGRFQKKLPIIALTAHVSAEHRRACLDAGMDDLLSKPIIVDDLRTTLDRWLIRS